MGRRGALAAACSGSLLLGIAPPAATGSGLATAKVAFGLAQIIRQDARQAGRRSKASVTVVKRCCGRRVLRGHYRAKPTRYVKRGAYVLRLETRRGVVQGVAIFESATEVRTTPNEGSWE